MVEKQDEKERGVRLLMYIFLDLKVENILLLEYLTRK